MNHALMKEKAFALYDGECAEDARREVEIHIEGCSECRAMMERWKATARVFFKEPKPLESEFFVHRVMERIEIESRPRLDFWRKAYIPWLVPMLGLAAALFFIVPSGQQPVSVETLLFEGNSSVASWVLSNKTPTTDDVLLFAMEEQS